MYATTQDVRTHSATCKNNFQSSIVVGRSFSIRFIHWILIHISTLLFRIYSGIRSKLHLEALKNGISESTIRTRVEMVLLVIAMNVRSILLKAARQAIALVGAITVKVRAKSVE